ncbi:uncharacterized protein BO87DRAFT_409430 [Aspergillus neoniger CBS 115656]|uniref:Uncharacterized protein n=1 Tax=Aspergillus neoniger (strain CBS 115656) TaxID=1448310 RepID=A0A318YDR1_ASPNB|nr:hypothetical protein BO87DRAFT_409430 [Aspergillus neoniger CBS 115656]PYH30820.1 hypothetical protein BO87DRAFT_409430 [Aspergillus neoniger CBS 115656]
MAVISAPDLALIGALPRKGNSIYLRMHMVHDITGTQSLRLECITNHVALTIARWTVLPDSKPGILNSTMNVAIHIDSTSATSNGYTPARPAGSLTCPTSEPEPTNLIDSSRIRTQPE